MAISTGTAHPSVPRPCRQAREHGTIRRSVTSPKAAPSWSRWTVPSAPWTRSRLPTCSPARSARDPDCLRSPQRAAVESSVRGRLRAAPARRRRADLHHSPRAAPVRVRATHGARRRGVAGGTGERLLSGASAPVAVAPAGYADASGGAANAGLRLRRLAESERALHWAAALARRASARLRVVAVHEPVPLVSVSVTAGPPTGTANQVLRRQLHEQLDAAVSALEPGVEASAELSDGGDGPLRAVLLGSVSSGLVRSAESPVVVVPRDAG